MRVDSICRHVISVVCGDDQANGMQTVPLWNTIGMRWLNYGLGGICLAGRTDLYVFDQWTFQV